MMKLKFILFSLILLAVSAQLYSSLLTSDNVVIILDASGSMAWKMPDGTVKMDAAKASLLEVLNHIPETTRIGLLVFSSIHSSDDWMYPLSDRDDEKIIKAIKKPLPGYRTPLGQYMKLGADKLLEQREKQSGYGTYRLLIITDGLADDQHLVNKYLPDILSRGIIIDVIGVDMKDQDPLANKVHSYRKADDPESLKRAVKEVFAEIKSGVDSRGSLEDVFQELNGIPDGLALKMINTLAETGNQPIGKQPVIKSASPSQSGRISGKNSGNSVADKTNNPGEKMGSDLIFYIVLGAICFISFSGKKKK